MLKYYFKIPKELRNHFWKVKSKELKYILRTIFFFKTIYKQRHRLFAYGEVFNNLHLPDNHLYWLANNTERHDGDDAKGLSYVRCWYGDEGFQADNNFEYAFATRKQKYKQAKKWIKRNNYWNGKTKQGIDLLSGFTVSKVIVNRGGAGSSTWRNKTIHGIQCVILRMMYSDELFFRFSFTKPFIFGYFINVMIGVETRYIFKIRIFK